MARRCHLLGGEDLVVREHVMRNPLLGQEILEPVVQCHKSLLSPSRRYGSTKFESDLSRLQLGLEGSLERGKPLAVSHRVAPRIPEAADLLRQSGHLGGAV